MTPYRTGFAGLPLISILAGCFMIAAFVGCAGKNMPPPPGAAIAGFDRLAFQEEFNDASGIDLKDTRQPGFNFYPKLLYGDYVLAEEHIKVSDGVLHLFNPHNNAQGDIFSAVATGEPKEWIGYAASKKYGGAYFEASIAFDTTVGKVDGFPAFWTMAVEHFVGSLEPKPYQFIEIDFMEYFANQKNPSHYGNYIHCWTIQIDGKQTIITIPKPTAMITTPEGSDLNKFNTYGNLWIPGENGRIDTYFNNELVRSVSFAEYPEARTGDDLHYPVHLGCGNWPMQVDWVRVWSK